MIKLKLNKKELIPFDLSAKPVMDHYLKLLDLDNSDYTFATNYLWVSDGNGFYSIINDTFSLFFHTSGGLSMVIPPIGKKKDAIEAMSVCFDLMKQNNRSPFQTKIEYVDESLASAFIETLDDEAGLFDFLADYIVERKLVDYVYTTEDMIELKGSHYGSKRNEINKFIRIHPDHELKILDVDEHSEQIMRLFNKWVVDRMKYIPEEEADRFLDGIYDERNAVKKMLRDYSKLNLIGMVLLTGGEIKGFTVGERVNRNTASVIIEKTDFEILGCAQFIFREFVKLLSNEYGVSSINVGDDMGFENLKKVKMSYRPSKLIPKYTIYRRQ